MELSVQAFDRICRACLTESSNMKSLHTMLDDGHELFDLFVMTANIQASANDELPKQVCGDCEAFINRADEFKKRCMESDHILKNLCQSSCDQYFVKPDEDRLKNEVKIGYLDKPTSYQEDELGKPDLMTLFSDPDISFKKLDVLNNEEKYPVKKEISVDYENDYSNDFDDREELVTIPIEIKEEKHEIKTHKSIRNDKEKYEKHLKIQFCSKYKRNTKKHRLNKTYIPIKHELECPKCNVTFDSVPVWTEHQQSCHSTDTKNINTTEDLPQFQCSLCLRKCKSKKTLSKHIKRHERTDNVKHTCTKCKREFKYKAFLDSHMLSVHVNGSDGYVCEECPEKFSTKKSLELHMDSHRKKKNVCPFCDKSFLMLCTLKDHLRIHTGEKPFLCSVCGKGFSQKTNLGQHMRRHMGVKPYKCTLCAMGFVSKGELDSHTRKHSGAHPFICDECGNGFTTSSALVKHRRTHTGERPYACDLCPMKFAATGTLKNHRRTHTGERPYQCSHCEKSFVQRSDLISHIRCHTGERPFVCPQCGQAFRKAATMKAHVKMHTRETQNVMMLQGGLILNGMQCDQLNTA